MDKREMIAAYAYRYDGSWQKIARAFAEKEVISPYPVRENYITYFDDNYPVQLRALRFPPWILFYQGNISLLKQPMITIVGSRELDGYGEKVTMLAANEMKKRFVLVSGLAKGADRIVHECALEDGHSIGVIGSGFSVRYPACNRYLYDTMTRRDLILSEYPFHTGVRKEHFPWRNRILAALGESLIVTAAKEKSGTMITVNEALSLSRDIYTFPYPYADEAGSGCNHLIADGAGIIYSLQQLEEIVPENLNC